MRLDHIDRLVLYVANNIVEPSLLKVMLMVYIFDVEYYRIHRKTYTGANWLLKDYPYSTDVEFSYNKLLGLTLIR